MIGNELPESVHVRSDLLLIGLALQFNLGNQLFRSIRPIIQTQLNGLEIIFALKYHQTGYTIFLKYEMSTNLVIQGFNITCFWCRLMICAYVLGLFAIIANYLLAALTPMFCRIINVMILTFDDITRSLVHR